MACSRTINEIEVVNFLGQKCISAENASLRLLVTRSVGPRILSLSFGGGENMMAELPDFVVDCPGSGKFHAYGGHRLWHAPEEPGRTYLPDDDPVEITPLDNGYLLTQGVELKTGLQKSMEICLQGDEPRVIITHRLSNHGLFPVTCAPWAITQLKVGGGGNIATVLCRYQFIAKPLADLLALHRSIRVKCALGEELYFSARKCGCAFQSWFPKPARLARVLVEWDPVC